MEDIRPNKVTEFDARFTNNHIRMFKVLLPFLPPTMQQNMAIYIKYMELQYTMKYFQHYSYEKNKFWLLQTHTADDPPDFSSLCDELLPYCNDKEKQQFTQMRNLFQTMRNMQDMMEMLETLREVFPEGSDTGNGTQGGFNPEMLAAMSSMFGGNDIDLGQLADFFPNNN